ncbi:MAG: pseudaminic acid synthase [Spirochaetaceae bacterium]|nr:pseudaminic acid synthase [Treponema sp.]MBP3451060.1 pseudaminic acid synthase [Spirochaetaceae bacterium]
MSVFVIAELSANHNQNKQIALDSIRAAKDAGADAVKIQTYTADTLTLNCDNEFFQIKQGTLWDGTTLYKLYQQAYTPWEWHEELFEYAQSIDIPIFSTPFDKSAVDFLEKLNNPIIKIASFELVDIPLIEYAASKGRPMIMSTGIATMDEIQEAVDACRKNGNNDITLLKCTSSYPAPLNEANLLTIPDMKKRFSCKVGLSDHSNGNIAACSAVALGAEVIEKHFIIDRSIGGPDAAFSMTKDEFSEMVTRIRETEATLGYVSYELSEKMKNNRKFSRSLFACKDIKKGEFFSEENIKSVRPGDGCSPKFLSELLGKVSDRDYSFGEPIKFMTKK